MFLFSSITSLDEKVIEDDNAEYQLCPIIKEKNEYDDDYIDHFAFLLNTLHNMSLFIDNSTNIAIPIAMELCKHHPYYLFGEAIWRIGALLCVLFGMPGHIIIVTVMLNPRNRRQPVCLYFTTIAIFEFIYLISMSKKSIFEAIFSIFT